jgi:hypothetical protein
MAGKRFTAEDIIIKLCEAEVGLAQGQTVGQACEQIGVSEQTPVRLAALFLATATFVNPLCWVVDQGLLAVPGSIPVILF